MLVIAAKQDEQERVCGAGEEQELRPPLLEVFDLLSLFYTWMTVSLLAERLHRSSSTFSVWAE